jgi:predicted AAA+ superfamily ATPase
VGVVEVVSNDNNGHATRKQLEVDFVVNNSDQRYYIQSAYAIPNDEKMRQETASLCNIRDSFKRIIVVKDNITPYHNEQGFLIVGLFDFLTNRNLLI